MLNHVHPHSLFFFFIQLLILPKKFKCRNCKTKFNIRLRNVHRDNDVTHIDSSLSFSPFLLQLRSLTWFRFHFSLTELVKVFFSCTKLQQTIVVYLFVKIKTFGQCLVINFFVWYFYYFIKQPLFVTLIRNKLDARYILVYVHILIVWTF